MKAGNPARFFLILAVLLSCWLPACRTEAFSTPQARRGLVDLRGWDPDNGPAELAGEWDFLPGSLLTPSEAVLSTGFRPRQVSSLWKGGEAGRPGGRGCASYRLRVLLPPHPGELAIRYTTASTAFELYAEGRLLGGAGHPAETPDESKPAYRPGVLVLPPVQDGALDLLITVSNHEYRAGGLWRPFFLGRPEELRAWRLWRILTALGFGCALAAMATHYVLLFIHRPKERSYLYFGLFCALVSIRSLVTGEYVLVDLLPGLPFDLLIRIEYASVYCSYFIAIPCFAEIFSGVAGRAVRVVFAAPHLPFILLIPFAPLPFLTESLSYYYPLAWISILGVIGFFLLPALFKRRTGSLILLIASFLLAAATANDILFSSFRIKTGNFLPLALAFYVFAHDLVLSRRFTQAFDESEKLSAALTKTNSLLQDEVRAHKEARAHLELLLSEKETHLQEIHHRVKNGLQIVSSIAALQAHRAQGEEAARALHSLRERVRAISLVHERLHETRTDETVDLDEYAEELVRGLARSYGIEAIETSIQKIPVGMGLCGDLGLILAELVTNSFRHGLGPAGKGKVGVKVRREGERGLLIVVEDSGLGYPPDFNPSKGKSLGFKIINGLLRKYRGRIELSSLGGARTEVHLLMEDESPKKGAEDEAGELSGQA